MDTEPTPINEPAGGDGLLFVIAAAIIGVVTAEAFFLAYASWWLMVAVLAFAMVAAAGVATALVRMMSDDETPQPEPEPVAEPVIRPAPVPRARIIAH